MRFFVETIKYLYWGYKNQCFKNALWITWWEWKNGPVNGPLDALRSIGIDEKTIQKLKDKEKIPEIQ